MSPTAKPVVETAAGTVHARAPTVSGARVTIGPLASRSSTPDDVFFAGFAFFDFLTGFGFFFAASWVEAAPWLVLASATEGTATSRTAISRKMGRMRGILSRGSPRESPPVAKTLRSMWELPRFRGKRYFATAATGRTNEPEVIPSRVSAAATSSRAL